MMKMRRNSMMRVLERESFMPNFFVRIQEQILQEWW